MRGLLITMEGVEGSGKTTQCVRLAALMRARGLEVAETSEPGGTPHGVAIRALFERDGPPPTPLAQTFLFMADRQQHVAQVVRPAIERGAVVLSDRYADATLAYQGYGQGVDLKIIRELTALATGGILPDLTLLLDLDPAIGISRIRGRELDAFEKMGLDFHRRVREGYLNIARMEKDRVVVVSADQDQERLEAAIARVVVEFLDRRGAVARGEAVRGA